MKDDSYYMNIALKEAKKAAELGEVPVGAILVLNEKILAKAHNFKEKKLDVTSHAEIEVIKKASKKLGTYKLNNSTLYVTLEPCMMCCGAIIDSKIKRVVFGAPDDDKGSIISNHFVFDNNEKFDIPLISYGVKEEESKALLKNFFKEKRMQ